MIYIYMIECKGTSRETVKRCLPFMWRMQRKHKGAFGLYYYDSEHEMCLFAETLHIVISQTVFNLVYAVVAAFFVTLFLIPHYLLSIVVMITVAQILMGVLGFMSLWQLPINTTTMLSALLTVGFSVDNAAHFCHAYVSAPISTSALDSKSKLQERQKKERADRVMYALNAVGLPILHGDVSTLLALLPLLMARSVAFITFFKVLMLVLVFGVWHGLCYLPVLFALAGPTGSLISNKKQKTKGNE